jgi:hypothetical protein
MKTSNIQNINAKSAAKGAAPRLPEASSRACAVKQITEQLELALEHIYQLTLELPKKAKRIAKKIPHIPAYIQLLLDFSAPRNKKNNWNKTKVIIIGAIAIVSAFSIGFLIS